MTQKSRGLEEEYFRNEEIEKLRRQRQEAARRLAEDERTRARELHWMRCPKCGLELSEVDYRDVRVDTCFACGGMFLDKGEIEKVLAYKERGWFANWVRYLTGVDSEFD